MYLFKGAHKILNGYLGASMGILQSRKEEALSLRRSWPSWWRSESFSSSLTAQSTMARPTVNPTHNTSNIARSLYAQCITTWRSRLCYLPYFTDEIHNNLYALGELVFFQIQAPSSPMRTVETGKRWLTLAGVPEPIYLVSLQWLKTGSYESCQRLGIWRPLGSQSTHLPLHRKRQWRDGRVP